MAKQRIGELEDKSGEIRQKLAHREMGNRNEKLQDAEDRSKRSQSFRSRERDWGYNMEA